ncbi:AraC family transcriptional regulator [Parasedimentitalea huanghaiensis]|uniref:Helix-turn-helix domain-containing protein n=1 Tax=Parasedimentitalea huanghaiensis TaxID=2682100 RepID=A0A6L6WRW8_9RHOB|nr:AraC family transcriptional regulator [Zongyanglinia huanghaiensis]MVO18272.1 helix-turn-helix domain-containing protein [Zongyanglinia huanghaiensis]
MPSVTNAFARAMAEAAGMTLTDEGALCSNGTVVFRVPKPVDGQIADTDYFDLIDWIRDSHTDEVRLVEAYASAIQTDDLGVLGLAIKTAPTLRASLRRAERYFRLVTDTAVYQLVEKGEIAFWVFQSQTLHRTALELRNECALAGFARNMHRFVGPGLALHSVSFRHACRCDPDRYAAHFGCPVKFNSDQDAIQLKTEMLDLSNRLGDKAVSKFLTGHLESKINLLEGSPSLGCTLLHHLTPTLSTGLPQAADIAREMGMSERTLYRRLAKEGLTFRDVLAKAQSSLAQKLLRDDKVSIAEIAFLTGFSEQSTFTRAFKRWVGKAPAQFRQQSSTV